MPVGVRERSTTVAVRSRARPLRDPRGGSTQARPLRVMVVGTTRLYRHGVATLLAPQPGVEVVAGEESGVTAAVRAAELRPDVVLLDMADPTGAESARRLLGAVPDLCVVGMGVADEEAQVAECAVAGLAGYVLASATLEELVDALHRVRPGQSLRLPGAVAAVAEATSPRAAHLTAREVEIVDLLEQSLSNREIAEQLGITVSTVKNHVHNLLAKLGARRRGQAVARMREGDGKAAAPTTAEGSRSSVAR